MSGTNGSLPTPPLRLRRLHLRGVGPDGARFDPLDLDFTAADGAASRVLLSLTNTGGKSTLITLVSSLIVPHAGAQVGRKNLGDYILNDDTSHVLCEWEDASTSTRTITGTVMEWRDGRRQPSHQQRSTTRMRRAWYLFRTGPSLLSIDDLPFLDGTRRVTFEQFTARVGQLVSTDAASQGVLALDQTKWSQALEERTSIDQTLFGYQMRMNDSEGGAEKLLNSFDTPDHVVRFFIGALNDERATADFTGRLTDYADIAGKRPALELLARFGAEIGPKVEAIATRATLAEQAAGGARTALLAGGDLAGQIDRRTAEDTQNRTALDHELDIASQRAAELRTEYGKVSDIRLQLLLDQARARLADAEATLVSRAADSAHAAAERDAWELVDLVIDLDTARRARDSAQQAYDAADAGLDELRAASLDAVRALAGRLDGLGADADRTIAAAENEADALHEKIKAARAEEVTAHVAAGKHGNDLTAIDAKVAASDEAIARAVRDGWLNEREQPIAARVRWGEARSEHLRLAREHDEAALSHDDAEAAASATLTKLASQLRDLSAAATQAIDRRDRFAQELAALATEDAIGTAGAAPADVGDAARAVDIATRAAHDADISAAEHEKLALAANDELVLLRETGTAPTGPDVLEVQRIILDARIGAVTGLRWVEENVTDPNERAPIIEAHPELAGGVVISDPARFEAAVAAVHAANPRTRTPVTIATASHFTAPSDASDRSVVIPHRATWDRGWAQELEGQLAQQAATATRAASEARDAAARDRNVASACEGFATRWSGTSRDELDSMATTAAAALDAATERRDAVDEERGRHRSAARDERDAAKAAKDAAGVAEAHVKGADRLADLVAEAHAERDRRPAVVDAQRAELARAEQLHDESEAHESTRTHLLDAAARQRVAADGWRTERNSLAIDDEVPDPGGNLDSIRSEWANRRDDLADAEAGMMERKDLERAKRAFGEVKDRLEGRGTSEQRVRAEALAAIPAGSSPSSRRSEQQRARDVAHDAGQRELRAGNDVDLARKAVEAAKPAPDREHHYRLDASPEWVPTSPADIDDVLARLHTHGEDVRTRRDAADQEEQEARSLLSDVEADIDAFTYTRALWRREAVPAARSYSGTREAARNTMHTLVQASLDADEAAGEAKDQLRVAFDQTRSLATSPQWRDLEEPAAMRVRFLSEADLIAEAALLARRIKASATSAEGDLAKLDTNRTSVRDELIILCANQRRLLRDVTKWSQLPPGLGAVSEQPTIKIRFEDAPADVAAARLSDRVDAWALELAANPRRAANSEVRTRWIADAVRDTVEDRARAGAFSVEILKPRIDGQVSYCPPDRIPHEFSGGQVLTLAVLVYCALSRVRASHRPGGARPPGCLILDNPFGAASAEALIAMQHRLAAHNGIQLICATALHDAGVDAAFTGTGSVIITLRNDADIRRNLSYLRLRATTVDGVDVEAALTGGHPVDSEQSWVSGTAYQVRT